MLIKLFKSFFICTSLFISLNLSSEEFLKSKIEYKLVVNEIIEVLNRNHFKKNIEITEEKVINNFLVNLDKEKIIFTSNEYNSHSSNFENILDLDKIFKVYESYFSRSLELINHQKDG